MKKIPNVILTTLVREGPRMCQQAAGQWGFGGPTNGQVTAFILRQMIDDLRLGNPGESFLAYAQGAPSGLDRGLM
jgi:hypothetical protein